MNCNLIKVENKYTDSKGKTRLSYNYYLVTENGIKIPVSVRYYETDKATSDKREWLEKLNFNNSQMMYAFADLVSNDVKD